MDVQIPQEQQAIIEGLIATGRYASAQEAISEGIRLLASTEQLRQEIQVGIDQADSGDLHAHDTVFGQLKVMAAEAQASNG